MITRVSFKDMTHEEWLAQRAKTIGGSDAGAVIGANPYSSPYALWAEKSGKLVKEDISEKEAVRLGHDLEQYCAERFMEATGKKVRRDNNFVYNSDYPFAHVQVDRLVVGENSVLECKTTSSFDVLAKCRDGQYPDSWYCQTVHEMAITGAEKAYLAILCLGKGFFWFEIPRDEAEIEALMSAERAFWYHVESDTPPAADGSDATTVTLSTIYSGEDTEEADLFGRDTILDEYMLLRRQRKAIDERMTEIENIIKADLQERTRGTAGRYTVSWKPQTRSTFSKKKFAEANPGIDLAPYYTQTQARLFSVKEMKE